jgi:CoA-transferase family III
VNPHLGALGDAVQQPGRSTAGADEVRGGGVGGGPKLVQVTAGAERRPGSGDDNPRDRLVQGRDQQRFRERVPQLAAVGVAARRPVQRDPHDPAVPLGEHRGLRAWRRDGAGWPTRQPAPELGAAEQRGVRERLDVQRGSHVEPGTGAQHLGEREASLRVSCGGGFERACRGHRVGQRHTRARRLLLAGSGERHAEGSEQVVPSPVGSRTGPHADEHPLVRQRRLARLGQQDGIVRCIEVDKHERLGRLARGVEHRRLRRPVGELPQRDPASHGPQRTIAGMSDEVSGRAAADWARSGVVALTGHRDGPPLVPPGDAATLAGAISTRLAAATAGSPHPVQLDGAALLAERAAFTGHRRRGRISAGGATRLLPTSDGWAAVSCARPDDPVLLAALVGAELPDDPWPGVAAWLRTHTGAELADRAGLLGLAAAPVDPATPPPTSTGRAAPAAPTGRTTPPVSQTHSPADRTTPPPTPTDPTMPVGRTTPPALGQPRSPAGLLVVDFSALWAGPLCAQLLGLAGARVVKVETPQRLDGARHGNRGFYNLLHAGHRAVLIDPTTTVGRAALAALVAAADIVIESSRPRALAGFGLDAAEAVEQGTTWVSITAAGRGSTRVGFGDDVAAGAGLVACDEDGQPVFCGDALADPLTGLVAAELAMSASPGGVLLDVSMAGVVAATLTGHPSPTAAGRTSLAARRAGSGWVVDTASRPVPVEAPRGRTAPGRAAAPGEHTDQVLRELRIPRP